MFNFSFAARGCSIDMMVMLTIAMIDAPDESRHELCGKKLWDKSFGDQNVQKIRVIFGIC